MSLTTKMAGIGAKRLQHPRSFAEQRAGRNGEARQAARSFAMDSSSWASSACACVRT
jgi:hypothetical protein